MPPERGWWRGYFHDHPGYSSKQPDAFLPGSKAKVYCKECMSRHIEEIKEKDLEEYNRNLRTAVREDESIIAHLWSVGRKQGHGSNVYGYLNSRSDTLWVHLKNCPYQTETTRSHASEELETSGTRKPRGKRAGHDRHEEAEAGECSGNNPDFPDPAELWTGPSYSSASGSSYAAIPPTIPRTPGQALFNSANSAAGPSSYYDPQPMLGHSTTSSLPRLHTNFAGELLNFPRASPVTAGGNFGMGGPSPWQSPAPSSHSPSPGPSTTDLGVSPSPSPFSQMRQGAALLPRRSSSRLRHSPYPAALPVSPPVWTPSRQARFDSLVTHLTASANFPLSWVENPAWLTICDEFIPSAKPPTRRVLTSRLLPGEVKFFRAQAAKKASGAQATLQGDGWTGINFHHLIAFMITADRKVHTVKVIECSHERKTAENFLAHIERTLEDVRDGWTVEIIAFTSDASGESRSARLTLLARYPHLIVLDCYAHQINLIVGDYLNSKSTMLLITDKAEELITWLRRRTFVLARIREVQAKSGKTAVAVIRAVRTRWTSNYLAFRRLLELQPALSVILAEDTVRGGVSTFMAGLKNAKAKTKAQSMIALMQDGTFWHSLNRIKLHLEPFAIAANVAQAAHCRLDQVLLIFGFLYHRFSHLDPELADDVAFTAVRASIEQRWAKADQAVFVAAVVLNPLYRLAPFAELDEFVEVELESLFVQLWKRLFQTSDVPTQLIEDIHDYLYKQGRFEKLDDHIQAKQKLADGQGTPIDPIEIWRATGIPGKSLRPLATLACRLLSVCANSASCERLFSIFGQILTKLRNRLGTKTLTALAELKMHLRDEYSQMKGMKDRLRRHCGRPAREGLGLGGSNSDESAAVPAGGATVAAGPSNVPLQAAGPPPTSTPTPVVPTAENSDLEGDTDALHAEAVAPGEFRTVAEALSRARQADTDVTGVRPSNQYCTANGRSRPFLRSIGELFDFSASEWLTQIERYASRSLNQELELYELLDFDAQGDVVVPEDDDVDAEGEVDDIELDDVACDVLHA